MILEEAINKLFRDIINTITGVSGYAIRAKQNAPRPQGSYADVDFISDVSIGREQSVLVDNIGDDDITQHITGAREIMLSLGFYRTGAMDAARQVRIGLMRQSSYETMYSAGVGINSRSVVRDISEALESGWEPRSQFDIVVNAVGTDEDIIRSILSVNIEGDFKTQGETIPVNVEVNT